MGLSGGQRTGRINRSLPQPLERAAVEFALNTYGDSTVWAMRTMSPHLLDKIRMLLGLVCMTIGIFLSGIIPGWHMIPMVLQLASGLHFESWVQHLLLTDLWYNTNLNEVMWDSRRPEASSDSKLW